jgi:small subunit ribosomal protein S4e
MGAAKTRKEVKYLLRNGNVKINSVMRKDENFPVRIFDTISFSDGKNFRLAIESGKFRLIEISSSEADKKVVKIIGKMMKGKNIQMNLQDGQNFLVKEKFALGDSAVVNLKARKVEKILPLKEGSNIEVVSGKYSGEKGKLKKIEQLERKKVFVVKLNDKEVGLPLSTLLVIE